MSRFDYDLFVIGAGSGGVRAARISSGHGARVAICEESRVGGTCVIRGCVPKKLLVYSSQFASDFSDSEGYGWSVSGAEFSWPKLIRAKDDEIDRLNRIYHSLLDNAGVTTVMGRGRVVDAHTVEVDSRRYTAGKILVAVGGRPNLPDVPGVDLAITSDEAFDLDKLPERILIAGGGYVAVEFAGILAGLGSEVTLVYRGDKVLRGFDDDLRGVVEAGMNGRGIRIVYNQVIDEIRADGDRREVKMSGGSTEHFDQVMFAIGRDPYTADLGLDAAGVETGPRGRIKVDEYSRSSCPSIYAVGDVTDRVALTPVALMEGHAFADTCFGNMERTVDHDSVPCAVFSQPPAASVGLTEHAARARHDRVRIFRSTFTPMKYTLSGRKEKALMKLVVEADSDRVVGVHLAGPDAPEILQGFAVAVRAGLTKADFDRTIGIHPTSAEELVTLRQPVD